MQKKKTKWVKHLGERSERQKKRNEKKQHTEVGRQERHGEQIHNHGEKLRVHHVSMPGCTKSQRVQSSKNPATIRIKKIRQKKKKIGRHV
jgi:hypothetical protein